MLRKMFDLVHKNVYNIWILSEHKNNLINNLALRSISKTVNPINTNESSQRIKKEHEKSQKGSAKMLQDLLNLRPMAAKDIVSKYKKFHKIPKKIIEENYNFSLENGILHETLLMFPEVLAESDIPLKMSQLKEMPYDINITTPLLSLTYKFLEKYFKETDRIALVSKLLEIDESKTCEILSRRSFLLTLNLDQLLNNVKLLTGNGITNKEIIKDLWVLRYSTNVINDRLDLAKRNGIEVFKTWMVRAQLDIFETYIRRRSDNKSILGDSSLTQYLSERLECTEEVAKFIICKHPALQNKSLKKMNETIAFLFHHGFKPIHICRVPKILLHSVETTRKRLKELEAKGIHLDSLYILTKSQRQYMQYYELLGKTGKSKLKNI